MKPTEAYLKEKIRSRLFGTAPRKIQVGCRYTLLDRLGEGATGVVYSAVDERLSRRVAVKIYHAGFRAELSRDRFDREAQALAKINHFNVVAVYDVGIEAGQVFIAMELIEGQTFGRWLAESARSWREILNKLIDAGQALAEAHKVGLVHRDFKPDNILIDRSGRVCVVDFGLAQTDDEQSRVALTDDSVSRATVTGGWCGTPAYMSPEQFSGVINARSDQFSFAVTLYEALFEQRPYPGRTVEGLKAGFQSHRAHVFNAPSRKYFGQVPSRIGRALLRALALDPADRFVSMADFIAELKEPPTSGWRRQVVFSVFTGLSFAALAMVMAAPPACPDSASQLVGVWDEQRAVKVRKAVMSAAPADGEALFDHLKTELDAYAAKWRLGQEDICRAARVERRQSDRIEDLRGQCMQRRQKSLQAFVDILIDADEEVVKRARLAVLDLPPLSVCADVRALTATRLLPESKAARTKWAAVESQMASARELARLGRYSASLRLARAAYEASLVAGLPLIRAEAQIELGVNLLYNQAFDEGETHLIEGTSLALRHGQMRSAGFAWQNMIWLYASVRDDLPRAETVAQYARSALADLPGEEASYASALAKHGWLYGRMGRYEEAQALQQAALKTRLRILGGEHPLVGYSKFYLASLHFDMGRFDEAIAGYGEVLTHFNRLSVPQHHLKTASDYLTGRVLLLDRRFAEAGFHIEGGLSGL
ncbi:MAG: serine/threonine-protein kinase, partial [Myxococcota bacterium]